MDIECCVDGNASGDLLMYIGKLMNRNLTNNYKKDQDLLLEIYKHLKDCKICGDYYTAFKKVVLSKDYNDYINKFGPD